VKPRIEKRRKKAKPPAWLEKSAPAARPPLARIPPSSFDPDDERHRPDPQPSVGSLDARTRGALIHRLLQSLPELPMGKRKSEAERWLAQTNPDLPAAARVALVAEAIAVIEHPALAVLFGAKSRAEVELMARLPGMEIPGRIDRLAVSPEAVWIADYKTDATPPESPHDAPENYVKQLALYRAALEKVYPEKALRAYLIWTAAPAIHEIPAARLAAALKHVTSA
jgi:ATP-dependent helicase/nuclease subunit A